MQCAARGGRHILHVRHQRSHLDQSQRAAGSSVVLAPGPAFGVLEGSAHCPVPGSLLTPPNSGVGPSIDDVLAPRARRGSRPAAASVSPFLLPLLQRATTGSVSFSGTMMRVEEVRQRQERLGGDEQTHTATRAWGDTLGWFSGTARPTTAHELSQPQTERAPTALASVFVTVGAPAGRY